MNDAEKIVLGAVAGVVGTLVTQLIIGIVKAAWHRREDTVVVEGSISITSESLQSFGCPGLLLKVIGKGKRPAKISGARLCLQGFSNMQAFQQAFGSDLGYVPMPEGCGLGGTLAIKLLPVSQPNADGAFVLERDDVCKFFLPAVGPLGPFCEAPSEDVSIRITLLDGTERVIIQGLQVQEQLRGVSEVAATGQFQLNPNVHLQVEVSGASLTPPDLSVVGRTNPYALNLDPARPQRQVTTFSNERVESWISLAWFQPQNAASLIAHVRNVSAMAIENIDVLFIRRSEPSSPGEPSPSTMQAIPFVPATGQFSGNIGVGETANFILPVPAIAEIRNVVNTKPVDHFAVLIRSGEQPLISMPGWYIKQAVMGIERGAA